MADSVDRVFGHALNTVNKIRPGSQKPPPSVRLALYGLYKQSMEGDVYLIAERPAPHSNISDEQVRREQAKWDSWKSNEGLSRTEAKRLYIEKLIDAMHSYAATTPDAKELVEELEFVWDQIKNNSQHSGSEHSSPMQHRDYLRNSSSGNGDLAATTSSAAAALEDAFRDGAQGLTVLSPVSQVDEDELLDADQDEFVDAPVSHAGDGGLQDSYENIGSSAINRFIAPSRGGQATPADARWRKRIESSLIRLTTEVTALREQLENRWYFNYRQKYNWIDIALRVGWWAIQVFVADAIILWVVIIYLRRKKDRRLEGAIRVLLGDAVAQMQNLRKDVKIPKLPRIPGRRAAINVK